MSEEFKSPPLRISNIVHGRRNVSGRVKYLLDPRGEETSSFKIPEEIVLTRWKKRKQNAYQFGGMRLSPNLWRSIKAALGEDSDNIARMSVTEINKKYESASDRLKEKNYRKVNADDIQKLIEGLGASKFQSLMNRHNDPTRSKIYGTPDLFLWALNSESQMVEYIRFVEVKKPREPLSPDQIDELTYLNFELNLKARVLRLREATSRTVNA